MFFGELTLKDEVEPCSLPAFDWFIERHLPSFVC